MLEREPSSPGAQRCRTITSRAARQRWRSAACQSSSGETLAATAALISTSTASASPSSRPSLPGTWW